MKSMTIAGLLPLLALILAASHHSQAQGDHASGCCAACGCNDGCEKVCRLVCTEKKVEVTLWGCKCEDFCVPGPSKKGCKHCELVGDDNCEVCSQGKKLAWYDWLPGCSTKIQTKKKLMKKVVVKKIPTYKWVVEDLCAKCEGQCPKVQVPAGTQLPPAPPTADLRVIQPTIIPVVAPVVTDAP